MTKSLGRTYSLLDFSGREMHYWPGNLPRRRAAPRRAASAWHHPAHCTCGVIARYTRLFSCFKRTQRAAPVVSSYFLPSPSPARQFPPSPRQSSRCAYIAPFWKGRPGRLRRTCVKSPRARCSCGRLLSLSESTSTRNFKSEICS